MNKNFSRSSGREYNEMRDVSIVPDILNNADGSCLIKIGKTEIICSATISNNVPLFLRGKQSGWLTAEYSMLPGSTSQRIKREVAQGKVSGRTQEIQRLIGRSLRSAVDLRKLQERQIIIDCDVINADGGTRTASITGGYVALCRAIEKKLLIPRIISENPIIQQVAAISCGLILSSLAISLNSSEIGKTAN